MYVKSTILIQHNTAVETDTDSRPLGIWRNREDAAAGGKGPWHRQARTAAREMYEEISFHTHRFVVEDGARNCRLEEYHS